MTEDSSPHVQRARQTNILTVMSGVVLIAVGAVIMQAISFPQVYEFKTEPTGAKVYVNKKLVCEATPCEVSFVPALPYYVVVERALHQPEVIDLFPFTRKRVEPSSMPILLKSMLDVDKREAALETCRRDREEALGDADLSRVSLDAEPCFRIPAVMPWQAKRSGHCHTVFDISPEGLPENIRLKGCTEDIFITSTKEAVKTWRYAPALENGEPILRQNVETRMSFRLTKENGDIIPEDAHFADDPEHTHDIAIEFEE